MLGKGSVPAWLVGIATMERVWQSLLKCKMHTAFDPAMLPLGLQPIEVKAAVCNLFVQEYLLQHCL